MTIDLATRRQFYAEELQATSNLRSPALVDALMNVPRERFCRPGPWLMMGEAEFGGLPRRTPDGDPRHLYHNVAVAIDPSRQLFNGMPSTLTIWIDALALTPGARVLHVGCGLGYYTALMAHSVGASGRVVALEVDEALAVEARTNLAVFPWVTIRHDDATRPLAESFDAIVVNAGVTHPQGTWLEALAPGGTMVLPLTVTMDAMGGHIGKGTVLLIVNDRTDGSLTVRPLSMVAIYSGVGLRDAELNRRLGDAMRRMPFPRVNRLRRDAHEPAASCWFHGDTFCFDTQVQ